MVGWEDRKKLTNEDLQDERYQGESPCVQVLLYHPLKPPPEQAMQAALGIRFDCVLIELAKVSAEGRRVLTCVRDSCR